jgi:hypothetical protein
MPEMFLLITPPLISLLRRRPRRSFRRFAQSNTRHTRQINQHKVSCDSVHKTANDQIMPTTPSTETAGESTKTSQPAHNMYDVFSRFNPPSTRETRWPSRSPDSQIRTILNQAIRLMTLKQYGNAIQMCGDIMLQVHLLAQEPCSPQDQFSRPDAPIRPPTSAVRTSTTRICNPVTSVPLLFDQEDQRSSEAGSTSSHRVNDVINTVHQSAVFQLYDHAFTVPSLDFVDNGKHDYSIICAAVVLYNMSLSYQLTALSGSDQARRLLETSLRLYGMSLKLIESLADDSHRYYHTTKLVLATANNMGHIATGFCDLQSMQVCRDCILSHYHDLVSSFDFYSVSSMRSMAGVDTVIRDNSCEDLVRFFSFFTVVSPIDCLIAGAAA